MRIIHLTDIHGNINKITAIPKWLRAADLVVLSGDITHFGRAEDAEKIIGKIEVYNKNIFAVTGNCDYPDVQFFLKKSGYLLENQIREAHGYAFAGLSGSLPCPGSTPNELSESQFANMVLPIKNQIRSDLPFVFISHQPPYNTKNDRVIPGLHVGSKIIRGFIEDHQPLVCLTGHIHEGKAVDQIGKTKIVNPGPFKKGKFAWITIENHETKVDLKKA